MPASLGGWLAGGSALSAAKEESSFLLITTGKVEGFLYSRHLKASTIRREEIVLRELAEHARQFGWQAWAPTTLTRVKTVHPTAAVRVQ